MMDSGDGWKNTRARIQERQIDTLRNENTRRA